MRFLIILIIALTGLIIACTFLQNAHADAVTAQAAIEAARAAQIASAGQTANTMAQNLIVLLLVVALIACAGFCGRLYYQLSIKPIMDQRAQHSSGRWGSDPNAHRKRLDNAPRSPSSGDADPLQQLIQLEVLRMLRENRSAPALPTLSQTHEEEELKW